MKWTARRQGGQQLVVKGCSSHNIGALKPRSFAAFTLARHRPKKIRAEQTAPFFLCNLEPVLQLTDSEGMKMVLRKSTGDSFIMDSTSSSRVAM